MNIQPLCKTTRGGYVKNYVEGATINAACVKINAASVTINTRTITLNAVCVMTVAGGVTANAGCVTTHAKCVYLRAQSETFNPASIFMATLGLSFLSIQR